ncbi:MAG: hypothetical protein MUC58_13775 [Rhizobiaceae bacterium]|nr:hypothetical protein [Rhizobiaceae bacterium]
MKKIAMIIGGAMLASTQATAQTVDFTGRFCFKAISQACIAEGWGPNTCFTSRFRPANTASNGPTTRVSMFGDGYATSFLQSSGTPLGATFKSAIGTRIGSSGQQFQSTWRFTAVNSNTGTNFSQARAVYVTGIIRNWDDIRNCEITFEMAAVRKP